MLILRDMIESDIEDYVNWFTKDSEWCKWDSPWEEIKTTTDEELKSWNEYYNSIKDLPCDIIRWKFEIEVNGKHIGWVSSYEDLEYLQNPNKILAVGVDIPEIKHRCKGYGTQALMEYINYLKSKGHNSFFIQTWSGNTPMIKVIEKIGFKEYYRKENYRVINEKYYDAITYKLDL